MELDVTPPYGQMEPEEDHNNEVLELNITPPYGPDPDIPLVDPTNNDLHEIRIGRQTFVRVAMPGQQIQYLRLLNNEQMKWQTATMLPMENGIIKRFPTWYNVKDEGTGDERSVSLRPETYLLEWKKLTDNGDLSNDDDIEGRDESQSLYSLQNSADETNNAETPCLPGSTRRSPTPSPFGDPLSREPSWDNFQDEPSYLQSQPVYFTSNPETGPGFRSTSFPLPHHCLDQPHNPLQPNRVYDLSQVLPVQPHPDPPLSNQPHLNPNMVRTRQLRGPNLPKFFDCFNEGRDIKTLISDIRAVFQ